MFRASSMVDYKESSQSPLLDYVESIRAQESLADYMQIAKKKRLKYLVLRTPELAGMLWDIAEDVAGKFDFLPTMGSRGNGKKRIMNSRRWARNSEFRDTILSVVFDVLASGEGYVYLGAKATGIREQVDLMSSKRMRDSLLDEAVLNPMFKSISTTTMTNVHNGYNLTGYQQVTNGIETKYNVKEIIHVFFKRMAGRVDGYTSVATLPLQLELLWLLWINQYDLQAKGNMPDMFVIANDIKENNPALKELESKLKKYNTPGNAKHGTTVLYGGKYTIEQMQKDTSLQFEDVGKAITSVMAGILRYPRHRLGIKTKEGASDKDAQGNGDRDYWDMINKYQTKLADIFDTQLFEPFFGTQLIFDKSYKHDSVVENTAMRSRIDNINLVNNMLKEGKERIPRDDIIRFIQGKTIDFQTEKIPEEELEEIRVAQEMPMQGTPLKQKDEQWSAEKKLSQQNMEKNVGKDGGV